MKTTPGIKVADLPDYIRRLNPQLDIGATPAQKAGNKPIIPATETGLVMRPTTDEAKLNGWERDWLKILKIKFCDGEVSYVGVQNITLKLADDRRYTPDFSTLSNPGALTFWEVKGFKRAKNMQSLIISARLFPFFRFVLVTREGGQFKTENVKP